MVLDRCAQRGRAAAWHFCRHDDAAGSTPRRIVETLAAQLCARVPGFGKRLKALRRDRGCPDDFDGDVADAWSKLVAEPLRALRPKRFSEAKPCVLFVDALDELEAGAAADVANVLGVELPGWVRVFCSSRDVAAARRALPEDGTRVFDLAVDNAQSRADVRAFLAHTARGKVSSDDVDVSVVERDAERRFPGLELRGRLGVLEAPVRQSKALYASAMDSVHLEPRFRDLEQLAELRPPALAQTAPSADALFAAAARAQTVVADALADSWEPHDVGDGHVIKRPAPGKAKPWIDDADDPGPKGKARALEKCQKDYGGDFNRLCDLARVTLRYATVSSLLQGLEELQALGWTRKRLKNKFGAPTPLGYRDVNASFEVPLGGAGSHVVEVQLNLNAIVEAKAKAHVAYEKIRSALPDLCAGTATDAGDLEAFIMRRLDDSALEAFVARRRCAGTGRCPRGSAAARRAPPRRARRPRRRSARRRPPRGPWAARPRPSRRAWSGRRRGRA